MSRAGSVLLGARIVVEQSSLVYETHLLTPKSLVCSGRLVKKKSCGRVGSRQSVQDEVGIAENFWDHFGVAKRNELGTAGLVRRLSCSRFSTYLSVLTRFCFSDNTELRYGVGDWEMTATLQASERHAKREARPVMHAACLFIFFVQFYF